MANATMPQKIDEFVQEGDKIRGGVGISELGFV